ncbi:MAG: dienelactone hydrolase family protein [Bryobacterales bacterium]|nr:dienelactone hydrolase family protein [Bryobacterales bacterium]
MWRLNLLAVVFAGFAAAQPLAGTKVLEGPVDGAALVVESIHRYLDGYQKPAGRPSRERLAYILGATEKRTSRDFERLATRGGVSNVRWEVFPDLHGEGLLVEPAAKPQLRLVYLPDADGVLEAEAARFARAGVQVIVPQLMDRRDQLSGAPAWGRMTNMPHREFLWRILYPLGRTVIGVEVQKTLAAVDWLSRQEPQVPVAVAGYGEGGLIAMYAAALDDRIGQVMVSGAFGPREKLISKEPVYRDTWGLLPDYTDRAVAGMIAPRKLIVDLTPGPGVQPPAEKLPLRGAAPFGALAPVSEAEVRQAAQGTHAVVSKDGWKELLGASLPPAAAGATGDERRFERQFQEIIGYSRRLIRESAAAREKLWKTVGTEAMRDRIWRDMIGRLPDPNVPVNARTRLLFDQPKFRGYEVVMDVWGGVPAYGYLLVPKDIKPGERRPVVVCQHGLEGRPKDVADPSVNGIYKQFAVKLAEEGFVTFAPQNAYVGADRFRQINRKAHAWGLTQFAFITGQHQRILEWLGGLEFVDAKRIGFYGLSYGGFTAMRVPALLPQYALSISSGNFTEWVWKVASLDAPYVYPLTGEYDIPEFNFAHLTNHFEQATLIYPRPFMVERGHRDGVSWDEWVAFEYAKVFRHYSQNGVKEKTEIEYFDGPHEIHGVGTVAFLKRWLGPVRN